MSALIAGSLFLASCAPKDADIQAAVQAKEPAGVLVTVMKGKVTLAGEVVDETEKAQAETIAKGEKGVKSVTNNLILKIAETPVVISEDAVLTKNVADAVKDFPTVKAEVKDGIVTLTGEISKASLVTLMQHVNALKPKKVINNLTVK